MYAANDVITRWTGSDIKFHGIDGKVNRASFEGHYTIDAATFLPKYSSRAARLFGLTAAQEPARPHWTARTWTAGALRAQPRRGPGCHAVRHCEW